MVLSLIGLIAVVVGMVIITAGSRENARQSRARSESLRRQLSAQGVILPEPAPGPLRKMFIRQRRSR